MSKQQGREEGSSLFFSNTNRLGRSDTHGASQRAVPASDFRIPTPRRKLSGAALRRCINSVEAAGGRARVLRVSPRSGSATHSQPRKTERGP